MHEQHSFYIDAEVASRVNEETRVTSSLSRGEFQRSRLRRCILLIRTARHTSKPMQIRLYQLPVNNKVVEESVKWCPRSVKPQSRSKFLSPSFSRIFPPFRRAEPDFTRSICAPISRSCYFNLVPEKLKKQRIVID